MIPALHLEEMDSGVEMTPEATYNREWDARDELRDLPQGRQPGGDMAAYRLVGQLPHGQQAAFARQGGMEGGAISNGRVGGANSVNSSPSMAVSGTSGAGRPAGSGPSTSSGAHH